MLKIIMGYITAEQFFRAATTQDLLIITKYVKENRGTAAALNATDQYGNTALILAAALGNNLPIVQALIEAGVDLDASNEHGCTALLMAAHCGRLYTVQALIAAGISLNATTRSGDTALLLAVNQGHLPIVQALIAAPGITLNATNRNGDTALIAAAYRGHLPIVQALIALPGITLNATNRNGDTALIAAAYRGHLPIVQALIALPSIAINAATLAGETALILAAYKGHLTTVQALLAAGITLNVTNRNGDTALIVAAYAGHLSMVQALLDSGVDITLKNGLNHTAAQMAKSHGYHNIANLLEAQLHRFAPSFQERLKRIKYIEETGKYNCPISLEVMSDPVTVSSGYTYDRQSLEGLFSNPQTKMMKCPVTRHPIQRSELTHATNVFIKNTIEEFVLLQEKIHADALNAQANSRIPSPKKANRQHANGWMFWDGSWSNENASVVASETAIHSSAAASSSSPSSAIP